MTLAWVKLLGALLMGLVSTVVAAATTTDKNDLKEYLYLQEADPRNVEPIQEWHASRGKPPFLNDPNYPHPRIVEFYAHWCSHCQHFKPKYIEFARKLRELCNSLQITVETMAVSCVPNDKTCTQMKIKGYPTVMIYPAHSLNGTKLSLLHPRNVLESLGIQTEPDYGEAAALTNKKKPNDNVAQKAIVAKPKSNAARTTSHFMNRAKKETFEDAQLSLYFAMKTGVYSANGRLPTKSKDALENFLRILQKTLPLTATLQPMIQELLDNRMEIVKGNDELQAVLEKMHPPPNKNWSPACLQHGTGYTCGLWQVFHMMSIGLVEWNAYAPDSQKVSALAAADAIRNYIEHFFQCDECRANFLKDYDGCGHDRCNRLTDNKEGSTIQEWRELSLWLYETHNGVNVRLRQERVEAKEPEDTATEFEAMWPSKVKCPSCWLSEGRWDEDEIYQFLRLEYWPDDRNSQAIRSEMKIQPENDVQQHDDLSLRENGMLKEIYHDDVIDRMPRHNFAQVAVVAFALFATIVWQRKRRFDQKGYHKKRESDNSGDC